MLKMFSHSLLVVQCISFLCLTSSVSAAPNQGEVSGSLWSGNLPIARAAPPKGSPTPKAPPKPKGTITFTTENNTECNEFPDNNYGGSDPPLYYYYEKASKIQAACWTETTPNTKPETYIRTTKGCYINEEMIQASSRDFQRALPECTKQRPWAVKSTQSDYLLPIDGFWMYCYDEPNRTSKKQQVQWGARHVWCSVEGEKVGRNNTWWRDAHAPVANMTGVASKTWRSESEKAEQSHCYIPNDAFDATLFKIAGSLEKCEDVK